MAVLTSLATVKDTLSISLKESWVNSTVQFKVTNQTAPSFNKAAFWKDPSQRTAYLWGGWARQGNLPRTTELWQFTADDGGGGEWSRPDPANPDELIPLLRTNGASTATCNGKALYLGGYQSNITDSRLETGSKLPTPGLLTYDMETRMWANISTAPAVNRYGTSIYGAAACAEDLGGNGLFFPISGQVADVLPDFDQIENSQFMMNTANLTFYDVEKDKWYWQQTSGDNPDTRARHCVAGVQSLNGTYEMSVTSFICSLPMLNPSGRYVYGGNDFRDGNEMVKSDLYVLSLPGFVWFRANTTSEPRSSHACIVNNRQMIVVGGTGAGGANNYMVPDVWSQGLGVLDLPSLSWKSQYDADAGQYEPPQVVSDWYTNG